MGIFSPGCKVSLVSDPDLVHIHLTPHVIIMLLLRELATQVLELVVTKFVKPRH